jgi:hypothetical protein
MFYLIEKLESILERKPLEKGGILEIVFSAWLTKNSKVMHVVELYEYKWFILWKQR